MSRKIKWLTYILSVSMMLQIPISTVHAADDQQILIMQRSAEESTMQDDSKEMLQYGDFSYAIHENEGIYIYSYQGKNANVVIPDTIDGYPVVYIGVGTFQNHSEITSVSIPDTVKVIKHFAFRNCSNF